MNPFSAQNPNSIREMFGAISSKYDLINSVLSFGIHRYWKKQLVKESQIKPGSNVLDCATGTGDLAFLFEEKLRGSGQVIGCDFCTSMLEIARKKGKQKHSKVQFDFADVMKLPYPDEQFDLVSISFGIRNVKDASHALNEIARVLRPGGQILVLEFGQPSSPFINFLFNIYSKFFLPLMGGWISGQKAAYHYLQTSSAHFPCGESFLEMAERTDKYEKMKLRAFQFGIAFLYKLTRKPLKNESHTNSNSLELKA